MPRRTPRFFAVAAALVLLGWAPRHLEVEASYPAPDAVLPEAPTEIWLRFTVLPDMEETGFTVSGPGGEVTLGDIVQGEGDEARTVRASVESPMAPGAYLVTWVGASMDDHPVRGRFTFSVRRSR